jgi:hypothetical protein
MMRWLKRREREGWSWSELSGWSGHPIWKLRYWQRRLDRSGRTPKGRAEAFVAVEVTSPSSAGATPLEITTPSGYRVQVPLDVDVEHLRRVLAALERVC